MVKSGSDTFAVREWLAADGDARDPEGRDARQTASAAMRSAASAGSPTARWSPSRRTAEAFAEDCRRAAVVVSARDGAVRTALRSLIDRHGLAAIRRDGAAPRSGQGFEISAARPAGYDRPWARATLPPGDAPDAGRIDAGTTAAARRHAARRRIWKPGD